MITRNTLAPHCILAMILLLCQEHASAFPQTILDTKTDPALKDNLLVPPDSYEAQLNTNMHKKKEEMYLQTLKQLIPAMESLREEIVSKLSTDAGIDEESEVADLKMFLIENQLRGSQNTVRKFIQIQEQIINVTEANHQLLERMNTLYSNHSQQPDFSITSKHLEDISTLKDFLKQKPYPTEKILALINSQSTETGRIVLIWKLLQSMEISKDTLNDSQVLILIGAEINRIESSYLDLSLLPEIVRDIFTQENRILKSAKTGRDLILRDGKAVTISDHHASTRSWNFVPIPGKSLFLIKNTESNLVLGLARKDKVPEDDTLFYETLETTPSNVRVLPAQHNLFRIPQDPDSKEDPELEISTKSPESVIENSDYHWNIVTALGTSPGKIYLKFVNAAYGQVLDANSHGDVYPHKSNGEPHI
ncbi:unnamed protein product [Allacma fusca]|uniref:Uncharacterized protein n=1 Tax=Allacma fusca TaxID=39272 RepID=A0A8J2J235_9HEXA|nr:unnamed protein product [Allacma fusca]